MDQVAVTMLTYLDIRSNDNNVKVKVMRTWRLPDMKIQNEDYSIEMILMDEQGNKIQANVVRKWFFRFAKFLTEGACLLIKRPSIGINNSKYKFCNNPNKLSLNYNTYVFECADFNGPKYGFEFASFGSIIRKDCQCHVVVDVIGHVTRFFKSEIPISKDVNEKARLTMEVADLENNTLFVTLWDKYAHQMASHVSDNPNADHVIIVLQFARIKFHNEKAYVSNSFGDVSLLFINNDIDDICSYTKSLIQKGNDNPGSVPPPYGASMFFSVRDDFVNNTCFLSIGEICEIFEPKVVVIVGSVKDIFKDVDWYYMGCDKCGKKLVETYVACDPEDGNSEFKEVLECKNPKCHSHVSTPVPKFKLQIIVMDNTGYVKLTMWDRDVSRAVQKSASDLLANSKLVDGKHEFPTELLCLLGKVYAFKIEITQYNFVRESDVYAILSYSDDIQIILDLEQKLKHGQPIESESTNITLSLFTSQDVPSKSPSITGDNITPMSKAAELSGFTNKSAGKTLVSTADGSSTKRKLDDAYDQDESPSISPVKVSEVDIKEKHMQDTQKIFLKPKLEK